MNFDEEKDVALKNMLFNDKSNKGSVDKPIKELIDKLNSFNDYYTTSSCSGRIIILSIPTSGSKKESEFLFRTHKLAFEEEVLSVVNSLKDIKDNVWFRQEPVIFHVVARTLDDASKLLRVARLIGFKRSGLFEVETRFVLELMSTEKMDTIIFKNGKKLVDDDYVKVLVSEANKKLKRTWEKSEALFDELKIF